MKRYSKAKKQYAIEEAQRRGPNESIEMVAKDWV